ncbi:MAG: response regulator transcription factor [Chloroflexi bacterium]|nr:response regulator transcription factor [Chloroflexota bacterium]
MKRSRVVVVEDEPEMLDIMSINLEQAGYQVIPARDGLEGYEAVERADPDAVILDLNLPNMSGFRLARLLRRDPRWKRVPLIVATAFTFEEVEDLANEGIDGFITKPFDPADLVNKLEYILSRTHRVSVS